MSEAIKPTPGPWFVGSSGAFKVASVTNATAIYSDHPPSEKAIWSDAKLIAEAGTVHHETGLTPRQLVDRMKAVESAMRDAREMIEADHVDAAYQMLGEAITNLVKGATP